MITTAAHISDQPQKTASALLDSLTLNLTKEQTTDLIDALADPDRNLRSVADQFNTTVEALSLFTTRPDIAQRLSALSGIFAFKVRLAAANNLTLAVNTLAEALRSFHWEETHIAIDRQNIRQLDQRRHARETARKCASLLERLARFGSPSVTTKTPAKLPLSEGGGRGVGSLRSHAPTTGPEQASAGHRVQSLGIPTDQRARTRPPESPPLASFNYPASAPVASS